MRRGETKETVKIDGATTRAELARRQIPQYRAAVKIGTDPAKFSRALNGKGGLSRAACDRLCDLIDTDVREEP